MSAFGRIPAAKALASLALALFASHVVAQDLTIEWNLATSRDLEHTVQVGDTVLWEVVDGRAHTVSSLTGPDSWDSGVITDEFEFTFTIAGTYTYRCNIHNVMGGEIVVEAAATTTTTQAATPIATSVPTPEPTNVPTSVPTPEPTAAPTPIATPEPTDAPTAEPTAAPTPDPTNEPTEAPTPDPTDVPTPDPTAEPTEAATPIATSAPTPDPTAVPTEAPTEEATTTTVVTAAPTLAETAGPLAYTAVDGCPEAGATVTDVCYETDELAATRCCDDDGETCTSECNEFNELVPYAEALATCQAIGRRLCTPVELNAGVCCNCNNNNGNNNVCSRREVRRGECCRSGCNFDSHRTWTNEQCGGFVVTAEPTEATAAPTSEPTAEPTPEPTSEPTSEPTAAPTLAPTPEPTDVPTPVPTDAPTAAPTPAPSAAPTTAPLVTVNNAAFQCNGRDEECRWSDELENWICEYEFVVTQVYTMREKGSNAGQNYPVSYPVFSKDTNESDWEQLYFNLCSANQYLVNAGNDCTEVDYELDYDHSGSDGGAIVLDGFPRRVTAINGQVPAPTLCVGWNDVVRVHMQNDQAGFGYEVSGIHWHGMIQRGSFWMDGPNFLNQCPVDPNTDYTYEFVADPPGTFWYHSHSGVQIADGMFGTLVVQHEPHVEELLYEDVYDTAEPDHVVVLADWEHESYQSTMLKHPGHWIDEETGIPVMNPQSAEDGQFVSGHPFVSGHINGHGATSEKDLRPYIFNVKPESRNRFRVVSVAAMAPFRVSVDDHLLTLIAIDGLDIEPVEADGFVIYPAERLDFVLTADQGASGTDFWFRAETLASEMDTVFAIVHYDEDPSAPAFPSRPTTTSVFETKCVTEECLVAACPWADHYRSNPNIKCLKYGDMRRQRDLDEIRNYDTQLPDVEDAIAKGNIIGLNFNLLGSPGLQVPNVEGIYGTLPSTPAFLNGGVYDNECDLGTMEGSFQRCGHVLELTFNETYLLVLTNRWPAVADPTSLANFPGIQTHPVHMHGHSFYVVAESHGTIFDEEVDSPFSNGCENGIGDIGPGGDYSHYCYDEETRASNLVCNNYWGDCAFNEMPELTPIEVAPQKDTIPIPVHGYVVIAIVADNPGWWFMHCHLDAHLAEGMNVVLSEAPEQTIDLVNNALPADYPSCGNLHLPERA